MRGNLFIRIFAGFWLVSIAVLGTWMFTYQYFDDRPRPEQAGQQPSDGPPHRFVLRLIYGLQSAPDNELPNIVERAMIEHGVQVFLIDRAGNELLGKTPPEAALTVAGKLYGGRRRAISRIDGRPVSAHRIYREEQGKLFAVLLFPPHNHKLLGLLGQHLWLRLLLAIIVSGLASWALSRLMTRRLRDLQLASRQLAEGELDTRLEVRQRGGDETDELSRDFNTMAEQLQQRMLAQKRLLSDVSHELRSPLARLRVALALAEDEPEKNMEYLQRIERETGRLEELIGQLLTTQQNSVVMDRHIDLKDLLRELCADASFEGGQNSKDVVFDTRLSQAVVSSSGDLLHRSFDNLIRNALRHTAKGTQVTVGLWHTDGQYLITVEDRGPGVPEEELEHIFEEFYRVDTARTREDGGHGLGLSIARRAIESHGGTAIAKNTGHGLLISVTLPTGQ